MAAIAPESGSLERHRSAKSVLIVAVFLLVAGTFLFMSNIGLLPVHNPWSFWPVALVAVGVAKLVDSRTRGERTWSILTMLFGIMFLLVSVGVFHVRLHDGSWPISILLIAMGIAGLAKALDAAPFRNTPATAAAAGPGSRSTDVLNDSVILGSWKRRFETPHFRGGQVQSIFGTAEIDLRGAQISGPEWSAGIELFAVFGSIKLRIPDGWKVAVHGAGYLGNFEDKTIPQARVFPDTATLIISGYSIGSSVEIEN
jgi:predicted membrane protein